MPTLWKTWQRLREPSEIGHRGFGCLKGINRWSGEVWVRGDVFLPAGSVLEIDPGTRVYVSAFPAWKFEYERPGDRGQWFDSPSKHGGLIVEGTLRVNGTEEEPVVFLPDGKSWGGIVLLGSAEATMANARIARAVRSGISVFDRARLNVNLSQFTQSPTGISAGGLSRSEISECQFSENGQGVLAYDFAVVRADRAQFSKNDCGVRVDDGARAELEGCAFRFNKRWGVLAQGSSRIEGLENGFEGNSEFAVSLQENARAVLRSNRIFHNGAGAALTDASRLISEDDKVGPNEREGFTVQGSARLAMKRGFVHSHSGTPGLKAHQRSRIDLDDSKFFGNGVAVSAQGESRWRIRRTIFQGNTETAVKVIGTSRGRISTCQFRRNRTGAAFMERCRVNAAENRFWQQELHGIHAMGEARLVLSGNFFKENHVGCELQDTAQLASRGDKWAGHRIHGLLARQSARAEIVAGNFEDNGSSGAQGLDNVEFSIKRSRFAANGVGIGVSGRASLRLVGSLVQSQRHEGFVSASAGTVLVKGNAFLQNRIGSAHFGQDASRMLNNRLWRSQDTAGVCGETARPLWKANRFWENHRGVECRDQSEPVFVKNRFERTREAALRCEDRSSPRLTKNVFRDNGADCLSFSPSRPTLSENRFLGLSTSEKR